MNQADMQSRDFFIDLRDCAKVRRKKVHNSDWKYAFKELAMAADRCDALLARATNTETVKVP